MATLLLVWTLLGTPVQATDQLDPAIGQLITSGGLIVTMAGEPLLQSRSNDWFIPASTIKIATALVAIKVLGPSHRFKTEFYLRSDGALCIKGYGDPFLTSGQVRAITAELKARGLRRITGLILDDLLFALDEPADGSENSANPYDAPNGALAVNFNSLPLVKQGPGQITSPEQRLPVLPLTLAIGSQLPVGHHRVNVAAFAQRDGLSNPLRYVGELFMAGLAEEGIAVSGTIGRGTTSIDDRLIHTYHSPKTLLDIIRACLEHSNNYIANQLFLSAGAGRYGYPATWEKAERTARDVLINNYGLAADHFQLMEGSGLSRRTRVTPAFMIGLLEAFKPYAGLLPKLQGILLKSGTMRHIYCYSGYFGADGHLDPFVILLNQPVNSRREILGLLHRLHRAAHEKLQLAATVPASAIIR